MTLLASAGVADAMQKRSWLCQSITGAAIPACSVTVYLSGTTTKATIYGDQAGSSALGNPITAGSDGTYTYYAPDGRYTEVLSASGFTFGAAQTQDFILHDPFAAPGVTPNVFATTTWLNATPNCTNVAPRTTGQTWCFDQTHRALKVWDGTAWATTTVSNVAASGFGGVFSLASCATIVSPITGQSFCFDRTANAVKGWDGSNWVQLPTGQVFNVQDYGALGDGVTDDSTAFQAAITAAQGTKTGVVYVPSVSTRYLVGTAPTFTCSGSLPITMIGDGKYVSVIRYTGAGSFLSCAGTPTTEIQGYFRDFTVQLTNTAAVGIDATNLISTTFKRLRFAWQGAGANGGTGISARPTNIAQSDFYNVVEDVTFDSVTNGIVLDCAGQAPNRWRILATTHLSPNAANTVNGIKLGTNSTCLVAGVDMIAPYFDQIGGVGITFGANSDRNTVVAPRMETAQGGSLFSVNAAANRTTIVSYGVHAGTGGTGALGLRGLLLGSWEEGLTSSGVTLTTTASLARTGDAGFVVTGPAATTFNVGDGTTAQQFSLNVNTAAANQGNLQWLSAGAAKWTLFRPGGTNDLELDDTAARRVYWTALGGMQLGTPTGGDKGAGTLNASSYYVHGTAIASMPLTNASGTVTNAPHMVQDTVTLTGGTAGVALAGAAAFTNATSYTCVCDDDTAIAACRIIQNGGNGFTIQGTASDVVRFICVGN